MAWKKRIDVYEEERPDYLARISYDSSGKGEYTISISKRRPNPGESSVIVSARIMVNPGKLEMGAGTPEQLKPYLEDLREPPPQRLISKGLELFLSQVNSSESVPKVNSDNVNSRA